MGNKGQLENADWMIGLLSRFLTSRLHYSIVSPSPSAVLSFPSQPRVSILACRCQFVFSLTPPARLHAPFQPFPSLSPFLALTGSPKRFSRMPRGWNIRLPNYRKQQRGTVSLRRASCRPSSFDRLCHPSESKTCYLPKPLSSLLMETPQNHFNRISDTHLREVSSRHVTEHSQ